ncbi:TrmH family RNA methyltransferase [Bacillus sp. Marseille-P3661]|uniref:TrmH family RNA methyltransferase n=1 Tax=Bacillus sp. Marseille-P3661 TaxID=1936234 RepID=UPI0015E17192|nr:RNA methyltransferase [Bacillus sp. Marseille-P3661]
MIKRIESLQNPKVKAWKKLHTKKERDKTGLFLIEGNHLIQEALKNKAIIQELIIRDDQDFSQLDIGDAVVYEVTVEIMKLLSETETPQGILAVCEMEKCTDIDYTSKTKLLLLDNVQDPGNVGTMIRTADAAGVDAVVLGEGCVDLYNAKVIRSTQGSLFHIPVLKGNLEEWIDRIQNNGIQVYGTALEGAKEYTTISKQESFALIVGNEGNGVDRKLLMRTNENLYIPIYGKAESLNVSIAAAVLLYHLRA